MGLDVQTFIDKQEIYEVLARYCRGVDRCDVELVRSVYHTDSYDDHGYWKGAGQDFADFVVPRLWKANSATMHSLSNVMIDINEDGIAVSEAHVTVTLVRRGTDPVVADVMVPGGSTSGRSSSTGRRSKHGRLPTLISRLTISPGASVKTAPIRSSRCSQKDRSAPKPPSRPW